MDLQLAENWNFFDQAAFNGEVNEGTFLKSKDKLCLPSN